MLWVDSVIDGIQSDIHWYCYCYCWYWPVMVTIVDVLATLDLISFTIYVTRFCSSFTFVRLRWFHVHVPIYRFVWWFRSFTGGHAIHSLRSFRFVYFVGGPSSRCCWFTLVVDLICLRSSDVVVVVRCCSVIVIRSTVDLRCSLVSSLITFDTSCRDTTNFGRRVVTVFPYSRSFRYPHHVWFYVDLRSISLRFDFVRSILTFTFGMLVPHSIIVVVVLTGIWLVVEIDVVVDHWYLVSMLWYCDWVLFNHWNIVQYHWY